LPSTGSRILVLITLPDVVFLPSEHADPSTVTVAPALLSIHSFTLFPSAHPAPLFTTWKISLNDTGRWRKRLHRLRSYGDTVAVGFSPNGKQLALAAEHVVTLWDIATGERLHRLGSYGDTIAVGFSPNGKQLVLAAEHDVTLWDAATGERLHRLGSYRDAVAVAFPSDGKQPSSILTNLATSLTAAKSTRTRTTRLPYDLDNAKDIRKIDFLHDARQPMTQVWNALLYVGGGPHKVNIDIEWQLPEFVRDGLDKTQDLATVLIIIGEPDKAYVCSYEDYMKLV